jgi:hypothetical protein
MIVKHPEAYGGKDLMLAGSLFSAFLCDPFKTSMPSSINPKYLRVEHALQDASPVAVI